MSEILFNPYVPEFVPTVFVNHVVAGVAGWVDLDLSAEVIPGATRQVLVGCYATGGGERGVRAKGETTDCKIYLENASTVMFVANIDENGFVQVYQIATNSEYKLMGYWT